MDVIDLDFIGNPEKFYGYMMTNDSAENAAIDSAWNRIKTIEEQIADIYNQLDKLKKPLRCKSLL